MIDVIFDIPYWIGGGNSFGLIIILTNICHSLALERGPKTPMEGTDQPIGHCRKEMFNSYACQAQSHYLTQW